MLAKQAIAAVTCGDESHEQRLEDVGTPCEQDSDIVRAMNDVSQRVQPARRKQSAIGRPRVLLVILAERDEYEPGAMLGVQVTHSDKNVDWAYTRLPLRKLAN